MKTISMLFTLMIVIVSMTCCDTTNSKELNFKELQRLAKTGDFFKLKEKVNSVKLSKEKRLYFSSIVNSKFGKYKIANEEIKKIISDYQKLFSKTELAYLNKLKLQNHVLLFEYEEAYKTSSQLILNYKEALDATDLKEIKNELIIWKVLKDVPALELVLEQDFAVDISTDKAGLKNVEVKKNSYKDNFVFDSGANFSTITRSVAKKMGLEILEANFDVGAITGGQVKSNLAIADSLILGEAMFNNVVFLVFEDKDLSIEQINYHIQGILGFPEIRALQEIHLSSSKLKVFNNTKNCEKTNLAFDFLTPLVQGNYNEESIIFQFDTGANTSHLFENFYKKFQKNIDSKYKMKKLEIGGAGGIKEVDGFENIEIVFKIGNAEAELSKLDLIVGINDKKYEAILGNLGQDYINQFDEMIINFNCPCLSFKSI